VLIQNFTLKNNWAPRIGATFDPMGDSKTKIYGNFGRYYARIPNDLAARALSADDSTSRADYFDAALTQPIPNGVLAGDVTQHFQLQSTSADTIDPNAKLSYTTEWLFGLEREVMRNTSVGVRYIHKNIGRVLEDVANAPMVAYDLGVPGLSSVEYILTNPSSATPVLPDAAFLGASFDDPVHKYQAVELTFNRRFSENWSVLGSYRWSQLRGNFEGFYRDDNGQSDPGISSLYDFPTNDPSYTAIGVPQFGYRGDIRTSATRTASCRSIVRIRSRSSAATAPEGLGLAENRSELGAPLTPAASPNYTNGGEIPKGARIGHSDDRRFKTRTPFQHTVNLQASYKFGLGGAKNLTLLADVFNRSTRRQS
jgi:hypothetical protein